MLKSLASITPTPRMIRYSLFLLTLLLIAAAGSLASLNLVQAQSANGVYDADGDRLIEVSNLEQLWSIHYDIDGNGRADSSSYIDSYAVGYPLGDNELVCDRSCNGYELARSLDFNDAGSYASGQVNADWTRGGGWTPIRNFGATFEGNGHTISNLYMDVTLQTNQENAGLFGWIDSSAVIRDVGLLDVEVTGVSRVGGLVGRNKGQVRYSYATGTVSGTGSLVGGLVGRNEGTVSQSYSTAGVTGSGANSDEVGGLVGWNVSTITESYATGAVTGDDWVGGLAGHNGFGTSVSGVISISYATGDVTGDYNVGGLVGGSFSTADKSNYRAFIRSSYATGSVTGTERVGGLVGRAGYCRLPGHRNRCSSFFDDEFFSTITGSYAIGAVAGNSNTGGLLGHGEYQPDDYILTVVADSYRNTDVQGHRGGWGTGKTTAELQAPTGRTGIYAGWSSRNWDFGDSSQYPALKADLNGDGTATAWEFGGQGRAAPPMPPGAAAITSVAPGPGSLTVSWRAPSGDASGITAYDLRHILTSADETVDANWTTLDDVWTGSGSLQYVLAGLAGGTQYGVQVRAVNSIGDGPWSDTATGTPAQPMVASATRSISPATVAPGGMVTVTITAANYGVFGEVTETLPAGFTYESSTHGLVTNPVDGNSQKVRFALPNLTEVEETTFSYTVTVSGVEGTHSFSGTLTDAEENDHTVGGDTEVTVGDALPGASVSHAGMDPAAPVRIGTAIPVSASFTEAVTGFTAGDVTVVNGTVGNFAAVAGGMVYTFEVTPDDIGQVTVDIAAGVAEDAEGNGNTAAEQLRLGIPYDDNRNGVIERREVIRAITDYLGDGNVERSHVIALINLYRSPLPGS